MRKDLERLPKLYAKAGVSELWLTDCRGVELTFEIHILGSGSYEPQPANAEGWRFSPLLGRSVRLVRSRNQLSRWVYDLETRA